MNKIVLTLVVLLGLSTACYAAEDITGRIDTDILVGGSFPTSSDADNAILVQGRVNYAMSPQWSTGVSLGWTDPRVRGKNTVGTKIEAGDETLVPLMAEVIYHVPTGDYPVHPYLNLALGCMMVNHGGNNDLTANRIEVQDHDGYAFKVAGGVDWFINENWAYTFEIGYMLTGAHVRLINSANNLETDNLDLDYWYVALGLRYRFD